MESHVTPRIIDCLTQHAFTKRKIDTALSLTQAKDAVAQDHGYANWQHLKNSVVIPLAKTIENLPSLLGKLHLQAIDDDEVYTFEFTLSDFDDADYDKEIIIASLRGAYYREAEHSQDLVLSWDAESQDLSDFAGFFKNSSEQDFENIDGDLVQSFAYVSDMVIAEGYDELAVGKQMIRKMMKQFGSLFDAVFVHPYPQVTWTNRKRQNWQFSDSNRTRMMLHKKIYTDLGFTPIKDEPYFFIHNDYRNEKLYGNPIAPIVEL